MKLKNKTVVITGAAGGFGQELVKLCCQKGAQVEALDLNQNLLTHLKKNMEDSGYAIQTYKIDVSQSQNFKTYLASLKKRKITPEIWINNAGTSYPQSFEKTSEETFQKIMDVNLYGVVHGTKAAINFMKNLPKAIIVNIASASGHLPSPFLVSYSTSKHAVVGFTRSLQLELAQQGSPIKMCLVSPGFSETGIMKTNLKEFPIPKWLRWTLSSPLSVAKDIVNAIEKEKEEIYPTFTGPAFLKMYQYAPKSVFRLATRVMMARNWKEMVGLENIRTN